MSWLFLFLTIFALTSANWIYPLTYENFPSDYVINTAIVFSTVVLVCAVQYFVRKSFQKYAVIRVLGIKLL